MSSSDPSGFVTNPPSTIVKVVNTARNDVNGQMCMVVGYQDDRGRYFCSCMTNPALGTLSLKPDNLVKASYVESLKAQYYQLRHDPRVRQELSRIYQTASNMLPPGVKPEYVGGAVMVLLAVTMYFMGFSKTMMLVSLVLMVAMIVAPDIVDASRTTAGRVTVKTIIANFPMRCHSVITQSVPFLRGRLSNRMAMGIVLFMLAMGTRSLFLSNSPKRGAGAAAKLPPASSPMNSNALRQQQEEWYKLGFDDATAGKSFGASMPVAATTRATAGGNLDATDRDLLDELDDLPPYDYSAGIPPTKKKSKLNFSTAASAFVILKTGFELARGPDGSFSMPLLMTNIRHMDTWKWGILGYSVYNLVSTFLL